MTWAKKEVLKLVEGLENLGTAREYAALACAASFSGHKGRILKVQAI
jgi:hypothetical protein